MKKILGIMAIAVLLTATAMAATMTIVSDTDTLVYGPIDHYAEIDSTDWGTSNNAVVTWKHPLWPTIDGAYWISSAYYTEDAQNDSWRLFEREIVLPSCVTNLSGNIVSVTSDNAEEVYLNGALIGSDGKVQGPFVDNQEWNTILSYNLTGLQAGSNKLQFIVRNYAYPTTDPEVNPTGLIYKAEISYDEVASVTCYADSDEDGFGDPNNSKEFCGECGEGFVEDSSDCDDSNPNVNPDATEVCDTLDNDCDGTIDQHVCNWYCSTTANDPWKIDGRFIGTAGYLGVNRLMWTDTYNWDDYFTTLSSKNVKGKTTFYAAQSPFTLASTNGCSCSQILDLLQAYNPALYGNMEGHRKFGCSQSVVEEFTRLVNPNAGKVTGTWLLSVNSGAYIHDMIVVTQNPDGTISGTGGYPAGSGPPYNSPYNWTMTGQVTGNTITMTITYENSYTATISGTIDPSWNYMSGGAGTGGVTDWIATRV
ncbi:MAG: putative metal-binding motif-containing protein [Candidatus Diapherotrites archaeon]